MLSQLKFQKALIPRLFAAVGSYASLLGLSLVLTGDQEWGLLQWVLVGVATIALLVTICIEVRQRRRIAVTRLSCPRDTRDYMFNWIKNGGRAAIWTRDHSWVDDDEMRELLIKKSRSHELIFCLPKATELTNQLLAEGAEVVVYGEEAGTPNVSFTISRFEKTDSMVAIGRREGDYHVIEEFTNTSHILPLATELVRLAKSGGGVTT